MSDQNKIPRLNTQLTGPANYPEWVTSLRLYFRLIKVNNKRVWDIVNGKYPRPVAETNIEANSANTTPTIGSSTTLL